MTYPFNDAFRREVASRCAAFSRLPASDATRTLKHSAVAIALTAAQDGSGETTFLLTRRTDRLRAHGGQWALPGGRCDAGETPVQAALRNLFLAAGAAVLLSAFVLSVLSSRSIVRPISKIVDHLRASEQTGMLPEFHSDVGRIQEIRQLAEGFNRAVAAVREGRENLIQAYIGFMDSLANARVNMIATLDLFRDALEDLGGGFGVTDPVSGPVVLTLK